MSYYDAEKAGRQTVREVPAVEFGFAARLDSVMSRIGFYSGSFDPVTLGHTDIIARAARLVDRLVIGIGVHPTKVPLFSDDERVEMLEAETRAIAAASGVEIEVVTFSDLAVTAAHRFGASVIFRGLRDGTDFDYEMQMANMNGQMAPSVQTVFVAASPEVRHIAANLVRQIALMGGDVTPFVSKGVALRLATKAKSKMT
jgi:pantetheine-phosphate adenylyltransferase